MSFPKPAPPVTVLLNAREAIARRSGVTVDVRRDRGRFVWAVVRTVGKSVLDTRSGVIAESDAGPRQGVLHHHLDRAVRQVRARATEAVYCETGHAPLLADDLRGRGIDVSPSYPPSRGLAAAQEEIDRVTASLYRRIEVSTDASRGHRGWTGLGWMIDFGQGALPRLGARSRHGHDILEAELRAMLAGLNESWRLLPHGVAGNCEFIVRSDSMLAVRMLNEPGWAPGDASRAARQLVPQVREAACGLDVSFTWVKGHSGDPGNDAADRLAVKARRNAEAGLSLEQCMDGLTAVREDILAGLANQSGWSERSAHTGLPHRPAQVAA